MFALLFMPILAYAAYLLMLFLLDSFHGDGSILHQYAFGSRRQLAFQALSDGRQALPVFYAVTLLLWGELSLLSRFGGWRGVMPALVAGVLTTSVPAALLVEPGWTAVLPPVVAGLLLSLALVWARRPSGMRG
ncbi:MAG: hypothetical protein AB1560_06360 [Pseudomonadota bacterium]